MEIESVKDWNAIFIDLEEITSVDHFFKAFHDELMKLPESNLTDKITNKLKKWVSSVELSTSVMPVKATIKIGNQGADYFSILADVLNELEHHTLVVFDELTVLLESLLGKDNDEQAVRTFLNLFRALRSATSECTNYILNKIGWNIPFFIQLILSRLPVGKATEADVDAAYDSLLQTGSFDTWHERLDREYGKNNKSSKLILQYLCISLEGKTRDEVFNHTHAVYPEMDTYEFGLLMRALITDGYLVNVGGRYKFRSPLLRDYWKVTYC